VIVASTSSSGLHNKSHTGCLESNYIVRHVFLLKSKDIISKLKYSFEGKLIRYSRLLLHSTILNTNTVYVRAGISNKRTFELSS